MVDRAGLLEIQLEETDFLLKPATLNGKRSNEKKDSASGTPLNSLVSWTEKTTCALI